MQRFPLEEITAYISHQEMADLMSEVGLNINNVRHTKLYNRYIKIRFGGQDEIDRFLREPKSERLAIPYFAIAGVEFIKQCVGKTQGLFILDQLVKRARFAEVGHEFD